MEISGHQEGHAFRGRELAAQGHGHLTRRELPESRSHGLDGLGHRQGRPDIGGGENSELHNTSGIKEIRGWRLAIGQ